MNTTGKNPENSTCKTEFLYCHSRIHSNRLPRYIIIFQKSDVHGRTVGYVDIFLQRYTLFDAFNLFGAFVLVPKETNLVVPALLTRMSRRPKAFSVSATRSLSGFALSDKKMRKNNVFEYFYSGYSSSQSIRFCWIIPSWFALDVMIPAAYF